MLTNLICMHTLEKDKHWYSKYMHTLQLLLYLVMDLLIIFFQQNKLTITFNNMITSSKSD